MKNSSRKIKGKELVTFNGLTVFGKLMLPKRRGKMRVLIQIRCDEGYDMHISQNLSYTHAVDILFATPEDRNSKGLIV
jgi:hypothetical protein